MTEITIRASQAEIEALTAQIRKAIPNFPKHYEVQEVRKGLNGLEFIRTFVIK